MNNCLKCKNAAFDKDLKDYLCTARNEKIYILLNSDECKFYEEKEDDPDWYVRIVEGSSK